MAPLRGWGPKGDRVRGFVPRGHWRTLTFLGALRCDQLAAPCVFDGPINGECFRAYVEQQLVPLLKPGDSSSWMFSAPKSAALRALIRAAGARLCTCRPTHPTSIRSSRLSPRSNMDAFRSKANHRRCLATHRSLVDTIDPTECNNYFANAGYASVKK